MGCPAAVYPGFGHPCTRAETSASRPESGERAHPIPAARPELVPVTSATDRASARTEQSKDRADHDQHDSDDPDDRNSCQKPHDQQDQSQDDHDRTSPSVAAEAGDSRPPLGVSSPGRRGETCAGRVDASSRAEWSIEADPGPNSPRRVYTATRVGTHHSQFRSLTAARTGFIRGDVYARRSRVEGTRVGGPRSADRTGAPVHHHVGRTDSAERVDAGHSSPILDRPGRGHGRLQKPGLRVGCRHAGNFGDRTDSGGVVATSRRGVDCSTHREVRRTRSRPGALRVAPHRYRRRPRAGPRAVGGADSSPRPPASGCSRGGAATVRGTLRRWRRPTLSRVLLRH